MTYTLIDAPVSRASTLKEVDAWIKRLCNEYPRPQDDDGVRLALDDAQSIRKFVVAQQQGAARGPRQTARRRGSAK